MMAKKAELLDSCNDFAFKKNFGNGSNKSILMRFTNDILKVHNKRPFYSKIPVVNFLETKKIPKKIKNNSKFVGLHFADQGGKLYLLEMQSANKDHFYKLALDHAALCYRLKPVCLIAITQFALSPKSQKAQKAQKDDHSMSVRMNEKTHVQCFDGLMDSSLELPLFQLKKGDLKTPLDYWGYYLKKGKTTNEEDWSRIRS